MCGPFSSHGPAPTDCPAPERRSCFWLLRWFGRKAAASSSRATQCGSQRSRLRHLGHCAQSALIGHLRSKRVTRRSRNLSPEAQSRGQIVGAVSIRERPAEVEDRAIPGHWEGDLISGSKNSHIVTLVERHSRFTALIKVPSRNTDTVVAALTRHVRKLPASLRRSLTWDRGKEMAKHQNFTVATDVKVYFCDPQSPWQRGTNENTNRLLRQYFPRGTDLSRHPQTALDRVALRLNQRPRETLGFKTPADKLRASVAPTR